jgi:hypothetical protein
MMDSGRERTLDRILKLLAVAGSTTFTAEAETARRLAQELMDKHNLSVDAVEISTGRSAFAIEKYTPHFKGMLWEWRLAEAAATLCGCKTYWHGDYESFSFAGTVTNLEGCMYILAKLHEQRIGEWLKYKRKNGADSFGKFCYGYAEGVVNRVTQLTQPMAQIVAARRIADEWYTSYHKVTVHVRNWGRATSGAGANAGAGASFHRGEVGARRERLLK